MNRAKIELAASAAAEFSKASVDVLAAQAALDEAEARVASDDLPGSAVAAAQRKYEHAVAILHGKTEVLRLQLGGLQ
jgi:hypothetical protein